MAILHNFVTAILFALLTLSYGDFVYLEFEGVTLGSEGTRDFAVCTQFSSTSEKLPLTTDIEIYAINSTGCVEYDNYEVESISNNALFVKRGNCPFSTKVLHAAQAHAKVLLVASSLPLPIAKINSTISETYSLPILLVPNSAFSFVMRNDYSSVSLTPLHVPSFNINKVILLIIALVPLLIGTFFGGCGIGFLRYGLLLRKGEVDENRLDALSQEEGAGGMGKLSVLIYIFCLLGLMVAFLLGLYFFYQYLVWVAIVAFCICTSLASYTVLSPFVALIPMLSWRIPKNNIPVLKYRPDAKFFILLPCCFVIPIWWVVCRQEEYAWVLQDFLGSLLVVYILFMLRFKTAISFLIPLLCTLVLYDVFFVFITPFFTSDGRSIMEYVALGPESSKTVPVSNSTQEVYVPFSSKNTESLPFLFIVPYITFSPGETTCQFPRLFLAGLGFGDVALPGLYLTYCLYYDNFKQRSFKLTYLVSFLSYGLSLILAFIVSFTTKSGQPALLYLVPSILISTLLLAIFRRDFKDFLFGTVEKSQLLLNETDSSDNEDKKFEP